jgi:hypothetical protein
MPGGTREQMFDDGMGLDASEYKIEISWRALIYREGDRHFKIYIDPPTRYGEPFTFYLPGPDRWDQVLPDWAGGRREEIVGRIKEECAHFHAEWVEG